MTRRPWIILGIVAGVAAALVTVSMRQVTFAAHRDEGSYLAYATRVASQGPAVFPALFQEYLQQAKRQFYPSPLRLTTIVADAIAVRLSGPTFVSLQRVSLLAFVALLLVVFAHLSRCCEESTAVWTTLLLAASPLHLAMARRALCDSLVATLMVSSLWLCIMAMRTGSGIGRQRWWLVSLVYLVTFLAKESTLVLIPISLILLMMVARWHRQPLRFQPICAVSVVPLTGAALLIAVAAGGPAVALQTLQTTVASASHNVYALAYGSGPWCRYLIDFLLLSPWTTVGYLCWLGYLLCGGHERQAQAVWVWALVPILFVLCSASWTKNVRYALTLEMPLRLGAVLWLQRLTHRVTGTRWATGWMAVVVCSVMVMDLWTWARVFVFGGLYDPLSVGLLQARGMIPP